MQTSKGWFIRGGAPFSGTVVESLPDGSILGEVDYYHGLPHGPERTYGSDGRLKEERIHYVGMPVEIRRWHPNGRLAQLVRLELGHKVEEHVWDENGVEIEG